MSFSSECRAETARVDAGRACCQETELRALTACSASYTLQGRGAVSLVYRVGSIPAARRIFVLLKNCFKVGICHFVVCTAEFYLFNEIISLYLNKTWML